MEAIAQLQAKGIGLDRILSVVEEALIECVQSGIEPTMENVRGALAYRKQRQLQIAKEIQDGKHPEMMEAFASHIWNRANAQA